MEAKPGRDHSGVNPREILCDQNHKQTTKTRNKNVTNITQKGRSAAKKGAVLFFYTVIL
ncbi:hypothetical protein LNO23_02180 [Klebsiella pneumoniae subsp. pneumoniae]|nr:hypothetical protein [Klebsiella pneumoniae subsp. pneumoniae]